MDTPHSSQVKKHQERRGRKPKVTQGVEKGVISSYIEAIIAGESMPTDPDLALRYQVSERTVRQTRLDHGLNRHHLKGQMSKHNKDKEGEGSLQVYTPYAGLWLLIPLILESFISKAVDVIRMPVRCTIDVWHVVLTLIVWFVLGFKRIWHLDDFRSSSDIGLALFTGRGRLLADSSLWRSVDHLCSDDSFYKETASGIVSESKGERISLDDHVVPSFTRLSPPPLEKTRIPTRGRSYPASRLYYHYDMDSDGIIGLSVKGARERLSVVLFDLIDHIRQLKKKAGKATPNRLRLLFDRGGYKGKNFQGLMDDGDIEFLTLAIATAKNVRQWEAIPQEKFQDYCDSLKIADTTTTITNCSHPIRSIAIRDDSEDTKQRWRVYLTNDKLTDKAELDEEYRSHQHHENAYRVLKHDLSADALPKAYILQREANNKGRKTKTTGTISSPETTKRIHLVAWIKALAFNLVRSLGEQLGKPYSKMYVSTLVRKFIVKPGIITLKRGQIHVSLEPFKGADVLADYIGQLNQKNVTIPWLGNAKLTLEVKSTPQIDHRKVRRIKRLFFANSRYLKAA